MNPRQRRRRCWSASMILACCWLFVFLSDCLVTKALLSGHPTSDEIEKDSSGVAQLKERSNDDGIIRIPLPVDLWNWHNWNFYHTNQCLWTGITAMQLDPVFAATHPERISFCYYLRDDYWFVKEHPNKIDQRFQRPKEEPRSFPFFRRKKIEAKVKKHQFLQFFEAMFWNISNDYAYEDCVRSNITIPRQQFWEQFLVRSVDKLNVCEGYEIHDIIQWYYKFLRAKWSITDEATLRGPLHQCTNYQPLTDERSLVQPQEQQPLQQISKALFVNRANNRIIPNAMVEQVVNRTKSDPTNPTWTYIADLGKFDLNEQLRVFASYDLVVVPHGATEANAVAFTTWDQHYPQLPAMIVEICPAYLHCPCTNVCPDYYKSKIKNIAYWAVAFENPDMNCTEYCSTNFDLPETQNANFPTKELVPDFGAVIDSIIDNEMRPLLDRYCREGDGFNLEELTKTTITTLYSCNVPFPKPKPVEGSRIPPDPYVPVRPATCMMAL
jgi:Glycosyltransferase 61